MLWTSWLSAVNFTESTRLRKSQKINANELVVLLGELHIIMSKGINSQKYCFRLLMRHTLLIVVK